MPRRSRRTPRQVVIKGRLQIFGTRTQTPGSIEEMHISSALSGSVLGVLRLRSALASLRSG